ncbi:Ubiquitin-conjugating enzyme E2C-binding protein [Corchorus capsularis]|uniref:Ubiquitin-conjugating enzyme E2C-binding protein n=1 Tax=Corchorus capsularis TaxID=210143 RepID=A0A1R3GFY5_COCAP|nr:Ubiquitin-conjugating enzyme E2C-binding protein [Corchorus capsularis]
MPRKNPENPKKWRFTWESQSHSPNLRLFLFDSQTKPLIQCQNLKVQLNLSQSQLLVSWLEEEEEKGEVWIRVPLPRVLIDSESPVSFKALDDHIEVKLVLLLPVDHPIVSSFDSVLLNSSENGNDAVAFDAAKPLVMDTDLKSLSSIEEGVHFCCRNCSNRLTKVPLRNFVEMPSTDWREAADNWFGNCCCSFGGISEKLVTRFANSYTCIKGVCLLNSTTVVLCKDDLVTFELSNGTPVYQPGPDFATDYGSGEHMSSPQKRMNDLRGELRSMHLKNDIVYTTGPVVEEDTNGVCASPVPDLSENETSGPSCCVHKGSRNNVYETCPVDQNTSTLLANQKLFLNGFLGNAFMAKSYNLSMDIEWREFACPKCLSLLGTYPFDNGGAPIDDGVRLFKCYISTCSSAGGSDDLFRKYSLERMFTNQLLENAKDELSFRTVVKDLKTKSPLLQIVLLNPNSWCCSGYCLDAASSMESSVKLDLLPVIKVLFSDCSKSASQLRVCEDWVTKNLADVVCMFSWQVDELIQTLASSKDALPPSCNFLQDLPLSSLQR